MRALDQFSKFCATIAGRIASVRPADIDRGPSERRAAPPDDKRDTRTLPIARDDEKRAQPPHGSYPAVWPRGGTRTAAIYLVFGSAPHSIDISQSDHGRAVYFIGAGRSPHASNKNDKYARTSSPAIHVVSDRPEF